jgi:hypothetical protein
MLAGVTAVAALLSLALGPARQARA